MAEVDFVGRKYIQSGGYRACSIRFMGMEKISGGGVATTTYCYCMTPEQRHAMARRITAALNLTSHLTVEQIEQLVAEQAASASGTANQ